MDKGKLSNGCKPCNNIDCEIFQKRKNICKLIKRTLENYQLLNVRKNFLYINSNFWIGPQNKNAFHFFDILVFFDFF